MKLILALGALICPLLSHAQVAVYQGTIVERVTGGGTDETVKRKAYLVGDFDSSGNEQNLGRLRLYELAPAGSPKTYRTTVRDSIRVAHLNGPPRDLRSMVFSSEATAGDGSYRYHALFLEGAWKRYRLRHDIIRMPATLRGVETLLVATADGEVRLKEREWSFVASLPLMKRVAANWDEVVWVAETALKEKGYTPQP